MSPRVLYLVTRFPAVTETFVVNEWLVLAERFSMGLVALRRSGEAPVHPETARVLPRVRFARAGLAAQLAWVARRPRAYLSTLAGCCAARCATRSPRPRRRRWCS